MLQMKGKWFASVVLAGMYASVAAGAIKTGLVTTDVDSGGPNVGSSDYYGSGPDDAFAEYGITTFNFSQADFGGPVTTLVSAELTLTVNDRGFSDGDAVEFYYTPDTAADLDNGGGDFSALVYDPAFPSSGINPSQFLTAPVSLGVFSIPEMAGRPGGETDTFSLMFDAAASTALLNSINTGTDFQILIAATVDSHDITYSGVGNSFDPGDPVLDIVVPEPSVLALLAGGLLVLVRRR
jgi:hypothetical protein